MATVAPTRQIEVQSPWSGEVVGSVEAASAAEAELALAAAAAFRCDLTAYDKAEILGRTADDVERRSAEFAASIVREAGTAAKDAGREVSRAVTLLRTVAEEA